MHYFPGKFFLLCLLATLATLPSMAQNDLPGPVANNQLIKSGSYIIAMDTNYQKHPGYFNMKAYGLVNELLQNEIPVKWAIKAGKTRTAAGSIDFTTTATRIFPDTLSMGNISFRSSAFIVDSAWVSSAWPVITSFGNNVYVYRMDADATVDIRYTLTHKPRILLLNSSGYDTIAVQMLNEAGFSPNSYRLQTPAGTLFNPGGNWSLLSESHWDSYDTARINPILRYSIERGANLVMNCVALKTMENATKTMTTGGIDSMLTGWAAPTFPHHDMPAAQFQGTIATPNGECKFWKEKSGSTFRSNTYKIMHGSAGAQVTTMAGMKLRNNTFAGGNLFYIAGHDHYYWTAPTGTINDANKINGRRIFLNSIFIPASDSIEGIDFKTDVAINMSPQAGFAVKNEPFNIYIVIHNTGPGRAKSITIDAPLPVGLLYSTSSASRGTFHPGTGKWVLDSLQKNQTDTLILTTIINQLGNITYTSNISTTSLEYIRNNNSAQLNLFGVSRPVAINDTLHFTAPVYQDYNVRFNDSDEDGGPFNTSTIIAGPFSGTATIINGDSIRYTISSSFTGTDSIQYITCDNYPLCDTAWYYIQVTSPLPVSLVNFTGAREENKVLLNWFTLNEKNNDYFDIERSRDGILFEKRGRVSGMGTTNTVSSYSYKDENTDDILLYYRLLQTDYDGTMELSNVIALPKRGKSNFHVDIFPNPGDGHLQVIRGEGLNGPLELTITDLRGRIISRQTWETDENGFVIDLIENKIRTAPGCYMARFVSNSTSQTIKLIIK
ncbi:MAG: T9SS type A sorting domain-containing protein [Bacteroidetes bacterium]|nr:T9SS type A sorting domain-containing protein [Bacteroidota bacterium]